MYVTLVKTDLQAFTTGMYVLLLQADTTIISVPCELLITIETVHKSSIGHLVPR